MLFTRNNTRKKTTKNEGEKVPAGRGSARSRVAAPERYLLGRFDPERGGWGSIPQNPMHASFERLVFLGCIDADLSKEVLVENSI